MVGLVQTSPPGESKKSINMSKQNPVLQLDLKSTGRSASNVNNSSMIQSNILTTELAGLLPVYLQSKIKRLGNTFLISLLMLL
ncbi:MAG: hypothetical protein IPJ75_09000 [Ignavibacteriales bacterium]|nr:hypothetical protein [Ignavibacteriales bacterium]